MKKRKAVKITLLSVLGVIIIAVAALCIKYRGIVGIVFNWDNIVSFVNSQRYSSEQLESKMAANKAKMDKLAKEDPHINIRGDLTKEEAQALSDGKITKEDAVGIVKGDITLEDAVSEKGNNKEPNSDKGKKEDGTASKPSDKSSSKDKDKAPPKEEKPQDRVSEIVAELYVVQAEFISRLEEVGDSAYADYEATMYDRSKIASIVDSYTATVTVMERECDQTVANLLKELEQELIKVNGDLGMVKEIKTYYYNEKSLKKSYYLNKMNDEDYK